MTLGVPTKLATLNGGGVGSTAPSEDFIATEAEAVAAEVNTKIMTPVRTKQQIDGRLATSDEAQTGTNDTQLMTPAKTAEAVSIAQFTVLAGQIADQTTAEAGTDNTKFVTPLRVTQETTARISGQSTAETGTDNVALMTPLRSTQQTTARIADQATAEAGLNNTKLMTPQRTAQATTAFIVNSSAATSTGTDASDPVPIVQAGAVVLASPAIIEAAAMRDYGRCHAKSDYGVLGDGNLAGTGGTDNATPVQNAVDSGADTVVWPAGIITTASPVTWASNQHHIGQGRRIDSSGGMGTAFNYAAGTGNTPAFDSTSGSAITYLSFREMSFWAAATSNARYIMSLRTPRNLNLFNVDFVHRNTVLVDSVNGGGCLRTYVEGGAGGASSGVAGPSWTNFFNQVRFQTLFLTSSSPGAADFNSGYANAIMSGSTDMFMGQCYVTQGTARFNGGGGSLKATGCSFDSASDSGKTRANVILQNRGLTTIKTACRVATTANITLSGTQTIDGVSLSGGDRVLVKNQTAAAQNGIWVVAAGAWARATDADTSAELLGMYVKITAGSTYTNHYFVILFDVDEIVVGTDSITYYDNGLSVPADQPDITAGFSRCTIGNSDIGLIVDTSLNTTTQAIADVSLPGTTFRRLFTYDYKLICDATQGASGFNATGASFVGNLRTGGPQEPRFTKSTGWRGEQSSGSFREIPDKELNNRELVCSWLPRWNSTTIDTFGSGQAAAVGTKSSVTYAVTDYLVQQKRVTYTTAAGEGSMAEQRGADLLCARGASANLGGFYARFRFAISAYVSGMYGFVGLLASNVAISDFNPDDVTDGLTQCCGVAFNSSDSNWRVLSTGASVATYFTALGSDYAVNQPTEVFDLIMLCAPNVTRIKHHIEKVSSGGVIVTNTELSSMPSAGSRLRPYFWISNGHANATPGAAAFDLISFELKTATPAYPGF